MTNEQNNVAAELGGIRSDLRTLFNRFDKFEARLENHFATKQEVKALEENLELKLQAVKLNAEGSRIIIHAGIGVVLLAVLGALLGLVIIRVQ